MAEWLVQGLTATISGVLTVFLVLILIALIIGSLQYLINPRKTIERWKEVRTAKKRAAAKQETVITTDVAKQAEAVGTGQATTDDKELVAVITAAIAASLGISSDKLIVRSIRRADTGRGWHRR